jgi:sterol desaturase/sphingolipid hydroxylase (fatty acid hydroxylase superfamily)
MSGSSLGISLWQVILTIAASIFLAELVGYGLHRILHSERFPALSRAHLIHHFLLYGPNQPMRAPLYKDATVGRLSLGNIGLEWLAPSAVVLLATWCAMQWFGVPLVYELLAMVILLAWPIFMFSYLHDRMHLKGFWMERAPGLRTWFRNARRLHDIHHRSLNDHGRNGHNFGIGFFFFDRLFRTLRKKHCPLNRRGYRAAVERYQLEHANDDDFSHFPSGFRV